MTWEPAEEPQVHSHLSDCLPDDHPMAFEQVHCAGCKRLVHAGNNECMVTWIEFRDANVCAKCVGGFNDVLMCNLWLHNVEPEDSAD